VKRKSLKIIISHSQWTLFVALFSDLHFVYVR